MKKSLENEWPKVWWTEGPVGGRDSDWTALWASKLDTVENKGKNWQGRSWHQHEISRVWGKQSEIYWCRMEDNMVAWEMGDMSFRGLICIPYNVSKIVRRLQMPQIAALTLSSFASIASLRSAQRCHLAIWSRLSQYIHRGSRWNRVEIQDLFLTS
jgi:hypothetical protein